MKKVILSEIKKFSSNIQDGNELLGEGNLKKSLTERSHKKSNLIYLKSLKNISKKIIVKTAKNECVDSDSTKLVIKKCHEALSNLFFSSDGKSREDNHKNYALVINDYFELINNIEPYEEISSKIFNENEDDVYKKIDTKNEIRYQNIQKAYKTIQICKEKIKQSKQSQISSKIKNLMVNLVYENDNISYIEKMLNYIYRSLNETKIPNKDDKLKVICNIKAPINKTAILYYKFMLKIKKLIRVSAKKDTNLKESNKEFIEILEKYLNEDSTKIAKIFNLPELEIYITKIGNKSKKYHTPLIENIKTNDPTKMLINLIVKIEIARELAKKRRMVIYNEKGKKQDSLIMIDYFDEYSYKLFEFLTRHHNIYNIKNFITNNLSNI